MPAPHHRQQRTPRSGDLIAPTASPKSGRMHRTKQSNAAPPRVGLWGYFAVIILVLGVFSPLLKSELLWSDYDEVERSPYESMTNWQAAWSLENVRQNDPISISSYFLEQTIPLPPAAVHHGINILLHLLAAILLLKSLQALKLPAAFSATLVFALHPATIQALFWSGYRTEIIGLIVMLAALYCGIRNRNATDSIATLFCTTIGCLIHPAAYAIPLILALIIFYQLQKAQLKDFNRVLPLICISLFFSVWAGGSADAAGTETINQFDAPEQLSQAGQNMSFFTRQALLPLNSGLFSTFQPARTDGAVDQINLITVVLLLPLIPLIACNLRKTWSRAILLGLGSYLLLILYGVSQKGHFIDGTLAHEAHRLYVALPFLVAVLVTGLGSWLKRIKRGAKPLWLIGISVLLLIEITLTASFANSIADTNRMWQQMTERWPDAWQPKAALVDIAQQADEPSLTAKQVIQHLEFILKQRPDLINKRILLARSYHAQGQNSNATREYKRVLRDAEHPGNKVLEEAAQFYDTVNLRWEAVNARQRMQSE
jgi:hypothetical protein